MRTLSIIILILLTTASLCNAKTSKTYKKFQFEKWKNYNTYNIPIKTAEEALGYANKNKAFDEADIEKLKEIGYKTFSFKVYKKTPKHRISFYEKRYKNGMDSKDAFERNKLHAESIGDYWHVKFHASSLLPSYSCNFYTKPTGEIIYPSRSGCRYNK